MSVTTFEAGTAVVVGQIGDVDFEAVLDVRNAALNAPLGLPIQTGPDPLDARFDTHHIVAIAEGEILSVARLSSVGTCRPLLSHVATLGTFGEAGIAPLLERTDDVARQSGGRLLRFMATRREVPIFVEQGFYRTGITDWARSIQGTPRQPVFEMTRLVA